MRLNKRVLVLLLINPGLLVLQFLLGFAVYNKIDSIVKYRAGEVEQRKYLRNALIDLLKAETNNRSYLLSGDSTYLISSNKALNSIAGTQVPRHFLDSANAGVIISLVAKRSASLHESNRLDIPDKRDTLLAEIKAGTVVMDSIKTLDDEYFAMLNQKFEVVRKNEMNWIDILIGLFIFIFLFNLFFLYISINGIKREFRLLSKLNFSLDARNKQLEQFTFMTYHNLKEPLRHISGFLQLLERRNEKGIKTEEKEYIDQSVAATKKMSDMINELRIKYLNDNNPNT